MSIPRVRLQWSLRVNRLLIAAVAATLVTAAFTVIPPWWHERGRGAQITQIFRGHHGWWYARDELFAMRWSNLQLMQETLGSPLDAGELPAWAEPPLPPYPESDFYRVATLAVGWPFPTRTFRWIAATHEHNFPIAAELDDADTSIVYAAEDARTHARAGGPTQSAMLWSGVGFDVAFFTGLIVGPGALLVRVLRHFTRGKHLAGGSQVDHN